ncbi:unnamed protein product [Pocillopora meandrina]|uniref:Uncharacterized protein n=1 Tax=Pocillopora meandrina TaxID=46732 RepID=A0AAU9WM52_9CNID|nr:unnamed protein product [Pocillopora meandrina]
MKLGKSDDPAFRTIPAKSESAKPTCSIQWIALRVTFNGFLTIAIPMIKHPADVTDAKISNSMPFASKTEDKNHISQLSEFFFCLFIEPS